MNKICEECKFSSYRGSNECMTVSLGQCNLFKNKLKIEELDLAKPYLNSNYYWKRLKELKREEDEK